MADFRLKSFTNKSNNQISITIPRKRFDILKHKNPKAVKLRGLEFEF